MKSIILQGLLLATTVAFGLRIDADVNNNAPTKSTIEGCDGSPNPFPLYTDAPKFVKSVKNGKLYTTGDKTTGDDIHIVHLWGTAYEKGYAQGQLMAEGIKNSTGEVTAFLESEVHDALPNLSPEIVALIVKYGAIPVILMSYNWTLPYMPQSFVDEMQGLADGSGASVDYIRMINMFPEITKASCTIVGANKVATPNGLLTQLRGLDIGVSNPVKNHAQITVYHNSASNAEGTIASFSSSIQKGSKKLPNDDTNKAATTDHVTVRNSFVNVGWTGMIGVLTGFNEYGVGVGEKVWLSAPSDVDSNYGQPWMSVLRDVVANARTIDEGLNIIQSATRTCPIHVGLGAAAENSFRGLEIANKAFNVYNDTSIVYTPGHPQIDGVFYWNKHSQPSQNPCLANLLSEFQSKHNLTAENLALYVAPISETGNFHSVTFDYNQQHAFVANSRKTWITEGNVNAYARQYTAIDMKALFAEKATEL